MHSTKNKGKSEIAELFITLKTKFINTSLLYQNLCIVINKMTKLINTTIPIIEQLK